METPKPACIPVLERAIDIWSDQKRRDRGALRRRGQSGTYADGSFCALGVLNQAAHEVEGAPLVPDEGGVYGDGAPDSPEKRLMQSLAGTIGMTPTQVYNLNDTGTILKDRRPDGSFQHMSQLPDGDAGGQRLLFNRMKEALARAKENAGE
jgi:hypothetical protein